MQNRARPPYVEIFIAVKSRRANGICEDFIRHVSDEITGLNQFGSAVTDTVAVLKAIADELEGSESDGKSRGSEDRGTEG